MKAIDANENLRAALVALGRTHIEAISVASSVSDYSGDTVCEVGRLVIKLQQKEAAPR
jgi:hypothetical protein